MEAVSYNFALYIMRSCAPKERNHHQEVVRKADLRGDNETSLAILRSHLRITMQSALENNCSVNFEDLSD